MYIHGCTKCHHEWESIEIEDTCNWCDAPSHNLGSTNYWEKMDKILNEMLEKMNK